MKQSDAKQDYVEDVKSWKISSHFIMQLKETSASILANSYRFRCLSTAHQNYFQITFRGPPRTIIIFPQYGYLINSYYLHHFFLLPFIICNINQTCIIQKFSTEKRKFNILGLQQIAIGSLDKDALSSFWVDLLGDSSYAKRCRTADVEIDWWTHRLCKIAKIIHLDSIFLMFQSLFFVFYFHAFRC